MEDEGAGGEAQPGGGQQMSEEQMAELQEKIKNMSPEELKEFQKKQCIFCHIISGKVQSKKIYEDDSTLAILDINPGNPGHVLILPKEHYSIMPQLSEDEIAHIFMVVKTISNACLRALGVQGTNIIVQNGVAAGQKAQHFMVHVIPRKEGDGLDFDVPQKQMDENALEKVRVNLEKHLGSPARQVADASAAGAMPQVVGKKQPPVVDATFEEPKKRASEPEHGAPEVEVVAQKAEVASVEEAKEALAGKDVASEELEEVGDEESPKEKKPSVKKKAKAAKRGSAKKSKTGKNADVGGDEETGVSLDDISNLLGG